MSIKCELVVVSIRDGTWMYMSSCFELFLFTTSVNYRSVATELLNMLSYTSWVIFRNDKAIKNYCCFFKLLQTNYLFLYLDNFLRFREKEVYYKILLYLLHFCKLYALKGPILNVLEIFFLVHSKKDKLHVPPVVCIPQLENQCIIAVKKWPCHTICSVW